jgi:uncharacterized protein (TIRG00374 family)
LASDADAEKPDIEPAVSVAPPEGGAARSGRPTPIPLLVGTLVGLGLLAWFLWNVHWHELGALLGHMNPWWLAAACAWMLVDYFFHSLRWWILLRHVDRTAPIRLTWSATVLGTGMNTILPFRAGALIRPAVVALRRGIPYPTVLFTTLAEGVCDLTGIMVITTWMVWYLPPGAPDSALEGIRTLGKWAAIGSLVLFAAVIFLGTSQARTVAVRVLRPVPARLRDRLLGIFDQLIAGLAVVGHPGRLLAALGVTGLIWATWLLGVMGTFWSLGMNLPVTAAMLLESVLALEMMIPQAPGFVGGFQQITKVALTLFGTSEPEAEGMALLFWAVSFVPVTVLGIIEGWRQGFGLLTTQDEVFQALEKATDQP